MRRSTCCLLVILLGSWSSGLGQSAPKLTTPRIVATFELVNQTSTISPTTVFTPKRWGTFQVSIVMVETVAGGDGLWNASLKWRDGSGSDSTSLVLGTTHRGSNNMVFAARMEAGVPLKFSTVASNSPGGKYNVWVVVEQLM